MYWKSHQCHGVILGGKVNLSNLKELYKGFLWGCGFAVATSAIYFVSVSRLLATAENEYRNSIREMTSTEFNTAAKIILPEIVNHTISDNTVTLGIKYANLMDAGFIGQSFGLHISLFSNNGKLLGTCDQPLKSVHSTSETIHTQIECRSVFGVASEFDHAIADVVVLPLTD